ncbi:MAG TPA: 7-cyano-7-deazaguanine synthase [Acidobacteriota bacterium]|jgi:7-cyano-7-deazaguanine synthase|nr:7-cyano-7-deazaguanine synthase [Acidobacteriota bacterium]
MPGLSIVDKRLSGARVAALCSGGLDSAVMLVELAKCFESVVPLYVRCGLAWEEEERKSLERFLEEVRNPSIEPVQVLEMPMREIYGRQWYTSGEGIPGYHEADERWEIPGRNIILLSKASVWCALHSVPAVALGILVTNPFPDADPIFFTKLEEALGAGLKMEFRILRPFAELHKVDVIQLGRNLPLHLTLSCASPVDGKHCGRCGKCRERIEAFGAAAVADFTEYATSGGG